jgi:hypothetical protein
MAVMPVSDMLVLIAALTTAIVTIMNARRGKAVAALAVSTAKDVAATAVSAAENVAAIVVQQADVQNKKLDEIHEATNGGVQALRDQVKEANARIGVLEALLKTAVAEVRSLKLS